MMIRRASFTCDECSDKIAETFHAILGGKAFRLCSETCRTICRARFAHLRPQISGELHQIRAVQAEVLPYVRREARAAEWG